MYPLLTLDCAALLIEGILYGVYAVTFSITLYLLRRRRQSKILTAITVAMFLLSTAHIVLLASSLLRHIHRGIIDEGLEFRDPSFPESSIQLVLECVNCVLGDSIIAWRAWVLWNRNKIVFAVPAVLLSGTFASALGLCHAVVVAPAGQTTFTSGSVLLWGALAVGLTFLTNIWAVVLIAYRFWKHHQELGAFKKEPGSSSSSQMPVHHILLFLIESGALYCCTLIVVAATFLSHTDGVYIMLDLLAQFTGIYPTLIVVLVCLQMTQRDAMDKMERSASLPTIAFTSTRRSGIVFAPASMVTSDGDSIMGDTLPREDSRGKDVALI